MPAANNKAESTKRTFNGKSAIRALIFEKALKHDVKLAYEICEKHFHADTRLTINGDSVLVLSRPHLIKKGETLYTGGQGLL